MPSTVVWDASAALRALQLRDLTDPSLGKHAIQILIAEIEAAVSGVGDVPLIRHRANPVTSIADNYNRLRYSPEAVARDARYTTYLSDEVLLRTHTSAMIPALLENLVDGGPRDVWLSCPGIVYRRDSIDRTHTGAPHQMDLWRIHRGRRPRLGNSDLDEMIVAIIEHVLPGRRHRTSRVEHPYTLDGRQIDVAADGAWVEVGECGLAHPELLHSCALGDEASGLAMGLGLDRMLMVRKGIEDIRLLRANDPRISDQMLDLEPYRPVSRMPAVRRDLSIAISGPVDAEQLGDRIRGALGDDASAVESVEIVSTTPGSELPGPARARLGMTIEQTNVLVAVTLRDLERTLTAAEANRLRDRIYAALHQGTVHQWATQN